MTVAHVALAAIFFGLGSAGPVAAQQTASVPAIPDLSGGWVRLDVTGSGSWDGLTNTFERAVLTPAATATAAKQAAPPPPTVDAGAKPKGVGEAYIVTAGRCGGGAAGINLDSVAFHMVQGKNEVLLVRETPGVRHIYLDGRKHPDPSRFVPTNAGHSVGRYEDGTLVVETVGLTPAAVPAGGLRTPSTVLVERFKPSPDGKNLTISYTWTDPAIYQKPHSYAFYFERVPPDGYAFEGWCDSSDPLQKQSIVPPEQLP